MTIIDLLAFGQPGFTRNVGFADFNAGGLAAG